MILGSPKEGLTFGELSQGWSVKRADPGEGQPFGALRWGLEWDSWKFQTAEPFGVYMDVGRASI